MKANKRHYRTIWVKENDSKTIQVIDQRFLPHKFVVEDLKSVQDAAAAIKDMHVRGAPLIGAAAAYGMYLAALEAKDDSELDKSAEMLINTRPTAIDLAWAVREQLKAILKGKTKAEKVELAFNKANEIADNSVNLCKKIGEHGFRIIEEISKKKNIVNILTHCNAGWLACVDYGTATAPIYYAFEKGIKLHVWVDETRPRNQGSKLTAWELNEEGIPHTIISDNAGGHLMQKGLVDLVIVGSDRTTYGGDVANKIGTYLKALAAKDNRIPFYVALPSTSFDWKLKSGEQIPIEERGDDEVRFIDGIDSIGKIRKILITPKESPASNYAFDVTPSRLVTGFITERGICLPSENSIFGMFPEYKNA